MNNTEENKINALDEETMENVVGGKLDKDAVVTGRSSRSCQGIRNNNIRSAFDPAASGTKADIRIRLTCPDVVLRIV